MNPGPPAPEAGIILLDHWAIDEEKAVAFGTGFSFYHSPRPMIRKVAFVCNEILFVLSWSGIIFEPNFIQITHKEFRFPSWLYGEHGLDPF